MTKTQYLASFLPTTLTPKTTATAYAPANIALSKYWGKRNRELNLPTNSSLSISLAHLGSQTTLTASDIDRVTLNGKNIPLEQAFAKKIFAFINLIRGNHEGKIHINTTNTIPTAAGLASSASGFAALTLALNDYYQLSLPQPILSTIARIGSGSASRSLWHGFVKWQKGTAEDGRDSYAMPITTQWQDLRIALLEIHTGEKPISSGDGMNHTTATSPLYANWATTAEADMQTIERAIIEQDFHTLGATAEANALAMHATMLAARPSLCYLLPETLLAIHTLRTHRANGLPVYFTIDAGPNLKLLYAKPCEADITAAYPQAIKINPWTNLHET